MSKAKSVPVQRGEIKLNEPTYKWTTPDIRTHERAEQIKGNRYRETMVLKTPK